MSYRAPAGGREHCSVQRGRMSCIGRVDLSAGILVIVRWFIQFMEVFLNASVE